MTQNGASNTTSSNNAAAKARPGVLVVHRKKIPGLACLRPKKLQAPPTVRELISQMQYSAVVVAPDYDIAGNHEKLPHAKEEALQIAALLPGTKVLSGYVSVREVVEVFSDPSRSAQVVFFLAGSNYEGVILSDGTLGIDVIVRGVKSLGTELVYLGICEVPSLAAKIQVHGRVAVIYSPGQLDDQEDQLYALSFVGNLTRSATTRQAYDLTHPTTKVFLGANGELEKATRERIRQLESELTQLAGSLSVSNKRFLQLLIAVALVSAMLLTIVVVVLA